VMTAWMVHPAPEQICLGSSPAITDLDVPYTGKANAARPNVTASNTPACALAVTGLTAVAGDVGGGA
jgi:hypothetical protein